MDNFAKDVRYAFRALRRQPGFAVITVLTLALGIGANTAVFSVVNGVLLRPLGYPQPERLEFITSQFPTLGFDQFWVSLPEFVEFRQHNQSFSNVGAYNIGASNLGTSTPSRPVTALVTPELIPTLGVPMLRGRPFSAEDSAPNAPPVAILSFELWQRSFGSDEKIVGQPIRLNDRQVQVVGIMPRGFDVHDQKVELWLPLTIDPATFPNRRGGHFLYLVGRLKDGVTREQALADMERMMANWRSLAPQGHIPDPKNQRLRMDRLREDVVGGVRRALIVLQAAVGFVLLIACANLANLLIARADSRRREYAVRAALGASRRRLFGQLLTEGLMLAIAAAVIGVGLAYGGLQALISINPDAIPRTTEIRIDWPVLAFTLGIATITGLVFALVPLFHIRGDRVGEAVKEAGTRTTAGGARVWVRSGLVVVEVALAVTLVVGAGLLIRSFMNLMRVDMGFNRSQLSTFGIVLPGQTYNAQRRVSFYTDLTSKLRAIPGVQSVAAASGLPPLRNVNANDSDFEHIPNNRPQGQGPAENIDFYQYVTVGYMDTMGIPIVSGRAFEPTDVTGSPVVLVNQTLAKKFFTDRDPIGQRVKPGFGDSVPWFTIVGVLKDVKQGGVAEAAGTEMYMLADQMPKALNFAPGQMNFVVRAGVPFDAIAPQFRQAVQSLDSGLPVIRMRSMDDVVDAAVARPRFMTILLGVFAGLALLLAAVGTYGVLSYLVSERKQEIGIRMALGADRARILKLVLVRGLVLSGAGLIVGLAASFGLSRVLAALLFNVAPTDPRTLAGVSGIIATVAVVACVIPAWRATRVDPLVVLRDN
jgi:putative ABC transport system permease protein